MTAEVFEMYGDDTRGVALNRIHDGCLGYILGDVEVRRIKNESELWECLKVASRRSDRIEILIGVRMERYSETFLQG